MSSYYDEDRARRRPSMRERRRDSYEDTVYDRDSRETRIVRRRDDSTSSVEEVSRDFPPGDRGAAYYRETTVRKSGHRPVRTRSSDDRYFDDRYDDRSYVSRRRRDDDYTVASHRTRHRDYDDRRRSRRSDDYSDYSSRSRSRTPPKKERRKSTIEEGLAAVGLGGIAATLMGKKGDKDRSRSRSRDRDGRSRSHRRRRSSSDDSRHRSKSRGAKTQAQISQALKAAVLAGASEAFRARKTDGGWGGEKGKRVLTAAAAAAGVDGLISNKRDPDHHSKRDIVGSALAGLATNRIINGPRSKSRGRSGSRSPDGRGRSQSRGGIKDLAAGGVAAATAKKIYDSVRSRSRGGSRGRSRSRSLSSDGRGSRSPPRRRRSQSVSAFAAKGLAALGMKDAAEKIDPERRQSSRPPGSRDRDSYYDENSSRRDGYGHSDSRDVGTYQPHNQYGSPDGGPRAMSVPRGGPPGRVIDYGPRQTGDPETDSESDLGSSSEDEKELKKGRKKQLITAGLASVATVHAMNSVYQSMEKRDARRKALKEGEITPEQARKQKNRNRMQDAASVGLAALGIKGAYSEWQEMREKTQQIKDETEKRKRHAAKREARRRKQSTSEALDYANSGYTGSMPNFFLDPADPQYTQPYPMSATPQPQPTYYDGNPYGSSFSQPAFAPTPPLFHEGTMPPPPPMGPQAPPPGLGVPRAGTQ